MNELPPQVLGLRTDGNKVIVSGAMRSKEMRRVFAAMNNLINSLGYQDITLDFSGCTAAFAGPILSIAALTQNYAIDGVGIDLILPTDIPMRNLFLNTNWAHMIDPSQYGPSTFKGHLQIPAIQYHDGIEQHQAIERIMDRILSALQDFDRKHLKAIEWSINEITDNVINHAHSRVGGFIQLSNFRKKLKQIEYVVCDSGIGIPKSLRATHKEISSDREALDKAIREGFTRDKSIGQGNGLYGSWRITKISEGFFDIHSGYARLTSTSDSLHIAPEAIPYSGTLVSAIIKYESDFVLEEALQFQGKVHNPVDYVELKYETRPDGSINFVLADESAGFGARALGAPVRVKLRNLAAMCKGAKVVIDFTGVTIVSSSFADEVFGKLFVEMGPIAFMQSFELRNVDVTIRALVDRAIEQRSRTGN